MTSPPSRLFGGLCIVCLVLTLPVASGAPVTPANGTVSSPTTTPVTPANGTETPRPPCDGDTYVPPDLDREWVIDYRDGLDADALEDWSGGRVVRIGATGECSLDVTETATLTAAVVDGTRGVVTGVLDLGANGSLRFVDAETNDSVLAISNPGAAIAPEVVLSSGGNSTRRALSTGRFFAFAVSRGPNGTARVAVWDADAGFDGEWDARFENGSDAAWHVRLDGRAFLDGIAVVTRDPSETSTLTDSTTPDAPPAEDDDPTVFRPTPFDPDRNADSGSGGEAVFLGGLFVLLGIVGFRYAYGLTRLSEQLDAIGSTTSSSDVEPAGWNVALTRIGSVVIGLIGLFFLAKGLL